MFGETFGDVAGGAIILVAGFRPRRTENGHGRTNFRKRLEGIHELGHDAENAPGVFAAHAKSGVAHGRSIVAAAKGDKLWLAFVLLLVLVLEMIGFGVASIKNG